MFLDITERLSYLSFWYVTVQKFTYTCLINFLSTRNDTQIGQRFYFNVSSMEDGLFY